MAAVSEIQPSFPSKRATTTGHDDCSIGHSSTVIVRTSRRVSRRPATMRAATMSEYTCAAKNTADVPTTTRIASCSSRGSWLIAATTVVAKIVP